MANYSIFLRLVNGMQRQVDLSTNTLVVQAIQINGTLLSSSGGTAGSTLVGDNNSYSNFTPTAATVKGALSGIDTALGSVTAATALDGTFRIENTSDPTKKIAFSAAGIATSTTRTITMPNANVDLGNLTNSNISASAAIAYSKLAALTANRALQSDGSGFVSASAVTNTELGYLSGVTSAIQTQLTGKASTTLNNLGTTSINADLLPSADNTRSIGSNTLGWNTVWSEFVKTSAGGAYIDMANAQLVDSSGNLSVEWDGRSLDDASQNTSVDWDGRILMATNGTTNSLNWATRVLAANDGSTALDWSSPGSVNVNSNKITNLANGTSANDAVNYSQLTSGLAGLLWQNPISDPDLVDDSLSTPPGSPIYSLTYIIAASPTGAWSGLAGHAVWWDGANWIDLSTGNTATSGQGTAVQVGDRFLVAAATAQKFSFTVTAANATAGAVYSNNGYNFTVQSTITGGTTLSVTSTGFPSGASGTLTKVSGTGDATISFSAHTEQVGGGLASQNHKVAAVTGNTPGSFTYTFTAPSNNWALSDNTAGSQHYGDSFTYTTASSSWINFAGPAKNIAGSALSYSGNTLNVLYDNTTIDLSSNRLEVKAGGITNTQVSSSAAIAYSKLSLTGSVVNADVASGAAIAYSKLNLSSAIVNADIASGAAIAYSKLNLTGSIVNADIASGAAIAYSKLALTNSIVLGDLTSNSVDENKIVSTTFSSTGAITGGGGTKVQVEVDGTSIERNSNALRIKSTAYDQKTITGGSGSAAAVQNAPQGKRTMVAGESFAANTSFVVRLAINGNSETTGRVYKADKDATTYNLYSAIGIALSTSSVTAGQNIDVVLWGDYTMGSSDSTWATGDIGKELFVGSSGAIIRGADLANTTNEAAFVIGVIEDTNKIWVDFKQLRGIA